MRSSRLEAIAEAFLGPGLDGGPQALRGRRTGPWRPHVPSHIAQLWPQLNRTERLLVALMAFEVGVARGLDTAAAEPQTVQRRPS